MPEAAGDRRAADLTTPQVERLTREWLDARAAPATVNRRLELLRQAYREAARRTPPRVSRVPYVPLLRVRNARQNFLSRADFEALAANIEDADVRDFVLWSWWTGMRPNESRSLTWAMLDREGWTLRLDPKAAKIGKGRVLALEGPLREIIERRGPVSSSSKPPHGISSCSTRLITPAAREAALRWTGSRTSCSHSCSGSARRPRDCSS